MYLGVNVDNKLDWKENAHRANTNDLSRLCFIRKLRSFKVCDKMLCMFYSSVAECNDLFHCVLEREFNERGLFYKY
jgi:hypothetical protein